MLGDLDLLDDEDFDDDVENFKKRTIERATPAYEKWA